MNVGLCDLYFMVQWFCLISPRLFDAWVSYFQIMRQCDPNFDLKVNMSKWPIFHGLVILLNIFKVIWLYEHHSWYNGSVWHIDWLYQVYVGQWPIFYGPAILLHILKTIWWRNVVLWENGLVWLKDWSCKRYVGQWPIFHGPLILPYIIVMDLKLFLYIKKWHRPGIFVPLRALALIILSRIDSCKQSCRPWSAASDLGLHCLHGSHLWDTMHIGLWVKYS